MSLVVGASAAAAIMLLGACGDDNDSSTTTSESSTTMPTRSWRTATTEAPDDGQTIVAKGFVELVRTADHGERPMNVYAVEQDGEVAGDFRMSGHHVYIECADTDTDGLVILGGSVAESDDLGVDELLGLIVKEGDPDKVLLIGNDSGAGSCTELVESADVSSIDDSQFIEVEGGDDIKTG
jgi:hypothetical protein